MGCNVFDFVRAGIRTIRLTLEGQPVFDGLGDIAFGIHLVFHVEIILCRTTRRRLSPLE